jgi:hypothetical protein
MKAPNSLYAKSMFDCYMELKGNIPYMVEHCPEALNSIREWAEMEYEGDPNKYYNFVEISFINRNKVIRSTEFPDAYVTSYREEIDTHSGQGTFTLVLRQKLDKMEWIAFNGESYGEIMRQRKLLKEQQSQSSIQGLTGGIASNTMFGIGSGMLGFGRSASDVETRNRIIFNETQILAINPREVFRSLITYTNNREVWTVQQGNRTRTLPEMLALGFRYEKSESHTPTITDFNAQIQETVYYIRDRVRIEIIEGHLRGSRHGFPATIINDLAYLDGGRSFIINPARFFQSLQSISNINFTFRVDGDSYIVTGANK